YHLNTLPNCLLRLYRFETPGLNQAAQSSIRYRAEMQCMKANVLVTSLLTLLATWISLQVAAADNASWPHPIPCRIQDGSNPDLLVMSLGDVETPLSQGTFDPVQDRVTLKDGTVRTNYYRDTLGVRFYEPLDKSRFPLPPSGFCTWYYYYSRINETEVKRNADWIAANLKDFGARYVQIDDVWQGTGARGSA